MISYVYVDRVLHNTYIVSLILVLYTLLVPSVVLYNVSADSFNIAHFNCV